MDAKEIRDVDCADYADGLCRFAYPVYIARGCGATQSSAMATPKFVIAGIDGVPADAAQGDDFRATKNPVIVGDKVALTNLANGSTMFYTAPPDALASLVKSVTEHGAGLGLTVLSSAALKGPFSGGKGTYKDPLFLPAQCVKGRFTTMVSGLQRAISWHMQHAEQGEQAAAVQRVLSSGETLK